ncbi:MAG TPA: hypothetical protein DCS93_31860 [Microscillaceae bacterium]|nr:hypothetical protein [Microscillaceae bacterium]
MKKHLTIISLGLILLMTTEALAQEVGNAYNRNAQYNRNRSYRSSFSPQSIVVNDSTMLVTARVLKYVEADEYVAVFGLAVEAPTVLQCNTKIDQQLEGFVKDLQKNGIKPSDYYIDVVTQNQVYGFDYNATTKVAKEKREGFELKKNIAIRYRKNTMLSRLVKLAATHQIFDLIKVDYLIDNQMTVYEALWAEARKIIERKKNNYLKNTRIKLASRSMVAFEKFGAHRPISMYRSYQAGKAASLINYNRNRRNYTQINLRKLKTVYYDPPNDSFYDKVLDKNPIKPMLQYDLQIQMRYEILKDDK